jgi:PAS domain-containing protein
VSDRRFRVLVERVPVGVLIVDGRGDVVECNGRAADMLEMRVEQLLAADLTDLAECGLEECVERGDLAAVPEHEDAGCGTGRLSCTKVRISSGFAEDVETMYILWRDDTSRRPPP